MVKGESHMHKRGWRNKRQKYFKRVYTIRIRKLQHKTLKVDRRRATGI